MSPIQDICLASANKTYGLDGGLTSWADQASTGNGINVALIDGIPAVISTLKMTLMLVCILLVILQSKQTFLTLYWKAPSKLPFVGDSIFARFLTSFQSNYKSMPVMGRAYELAKANTGLASMPMLGRHVVFAATQAQIEDFSGASVRDLCNGGLSFDRTLPNYVVNDLNQEDATQMGRMGQHILKRRLRVQLPAFREQLIEETDHAMKVDLDSQGLTSDAWHEVLMASTFTNIFMRLNNLVLFGKELANESDFLETVLNYAEDAYITEESLHFAPAWLAPLQSFVMMNWRGWRSKLVKRLTLAIRQRVEEYKSLGDGLAEKYPDAISWTILQRKDNNVHALLSSAVGFILGAAQNPPMLIIYTLMYLCEHPEYLESLREEAKVASANAFEGANGDMPLMDSFLKETARLHPGHLLGAPRKVISSHFTFRDGTKVPGGNWVASPHQHLMRDPAVYDQAEIFHGFRFVKDGRSESRLTHPAWNFTYWGNSRVGCPARFYVSLSAKIILSKLILDYDMKVQDPNVQKTWTFGLVEVPNPKLKLLMRKRRL